MDWKNGYITATFQQLCIATIVPIPALQIAPPPPPRPIIPILSYLEKDGRKKMVAGGRRWLGEYEVFTTSHYSGDALKTGADSNVRSAPLQEDRRHYKSAMEMCDPTHVPSLVCKAVLLKRISRRSSPIVRSLLTEALRLNRMNTLAWYNLGLLYKDEGGALALEAAECFKEAALLEETKPV
ncbi:tetratricopeptide repeat 7A-like [Olea europaea subsp. europaea]|uniref:Tetratricopeptide repeat 7A-like n=1 Tax=Olea europaea subsp. europaea TaxID=158383 RepID=A0A8S0VER4_OLEEU|nr:tetratricopeptide repeat 7A-like [Olea europaea subsp. europaea]